MLPRHEVANLGTQDRRASQAAADQHTKPDFALRILHRCQTDIVHRCRRAVFAGTGDRDFEFARQIGKLGMERAPLAQDLGIGTRIHDLILCHAGKLVAGDVAYAIA